MKCGGTVVKVSALESKGCELLYCLLLLLLQNLDSALSIVCKKGKS